MMTLSRQVPHFLLHHQVHQQHPARRAHRWGKEDGYCVVDGQKVPIRKTRLRTPENREQRLGSYELFQRSAPREQSVWDKMKRCFTAFPNSAVAIRSGLNMMSIR